ncbi:MAG: tetratricopeptide repeat protein [Promethearchaeota archaeon]
MGNVDAIFLKVEKLKENENFEAALEILENSHESFPNSIEVKNLLIKTLFEYGFYLSDDFNSRYEESINHFKRIIEIDPKNYRAYYNLGISYSNIDLPEEALKAYEAALEIKPDYEYCYFNIGLIYEAKNNLKKALEYHQSALKIKPHFTYALHAVNDIREQLDQHADSQKKPEALNENIEQLKSLFKISKRVKIDLIQEILKVPKSELINIMISWGEKYQFVLDGDYLEINKDQLSLFLDNLDHV